MFVIVCRYDKEHNFIYGLVDDIRKYHTEEILIVDSDSEDKSYFELSNMYDNVIIADIGNKNYHVGGYWYAYNNYDRDFYYFLHDSMRIKSNLDYLKEKDLTVLGHFSFGADGDFAQEQIIKTDYKLVSSGQAIYGPIFFCKRKEMTKLYNKGFSSILPTHSQHTINPPNDGVPAYALEGAFGLAFQQEGHNIKNISLLGDVITRGATWLNTVYDSSEQYPIEKFVSKRK